ncbi:MAG: hypothetical protein AAGE05_05375 [Pseudomonadota bacterium]
MSKFGGAVLVRYLSGAALAALAVHGTAATAQAVPSDDAEQVGEQEAGSVPQQSVATSGTPTSLSLPLIRSGRLFGDILVNVWPNGQIRYERNSLITAILPFVREDLRETFPDTLPADTYLTPEALDAAGVALRYDQSLLEINVERIDPSVAAVQSLGSGFDDNPVPITSDPEEFSAYLNIVGDVRLEDFNDFSTPAALIFGAVRYQGIVFEFDGGYDEELTFGENGFYRRQARAVYDEIGELRRWSAGDLQLNSIPVIAGSLIGGVGVEKGRRVFTGLSPLTRLGSQQVLLDRDATVEIFIDGQQAETLQLAAGTYDLAQLRNQYAGSNAQLFITDVTGRRQLEDFDTYIDPIDLAAGEDEYSAGVGFVARDFRAGPVYGGLPAFTGFYRRGLSNRLIVGGAVQLSEDTQVAAAEVIVTPKTIPGRFELSSGFSTGDSTGFALRGSYSLQLGSGQRGSQFSLSVDYRSSGYTTLADQIAVDRVETFSLTANYTQSLGERTTLIAGLNWFDRSGFTNTRTAFADIIHRFDRFRVTAGVEFGSGNFANDYGVRLGITIPFGSRTRADARYNSRRETYRASISRSFEDRVGSFGYSAGLRRTPGSNSLDASADYVGNRFKSRLTVTTAGDGFSDIDERQQARLQIGTSIAYAGGNFAIGRPISDSFVIARPHENISDEQVIIGSSINDDGFEAISGAFGPALGSRLQSYSRQNVVYDLLEGPQGYDIGSGIETLLPPYRSGYNIEIGTDATVSAYGFLNLGGERASLVAGTVTSPDDEEYGTQPFFTNSAGRFAIIGLRPGKTYQVQLFEPVVAYTISVPADSEPLFQLGDVSVGEAEVDGQE